MSPSPRQGRRQRGAGARCAASAPAGAAKRRASPAAKWGLINERDPPPRVPLRSTRGYAPLPHNTGKISVPHNTGKMPVSRLVRGGSVRDGLSGQSNRVGDSRAIIPFFVGWGSILSQPSRHRSARSGPIPRLRGAPYRALSLGRMVVGSEMPLPPWRHLQWSFPGVVEAMSY